MQGRHPLLDSLEDTPFQPNDTYLADCCSFNIIRSPNMSGKTTYLQQVCSSMFHCQVIAEPVLWLLQGGSLHGARADIASRQLHFV